MADHIEGVAGPEVELRVDDIADGAVVIGENMEIRHVLIADLKEQDVNAQTMNPRDFERLIENIRIRGALESMPLCAQPNRKGPVEIVSGHHRVRAARAAGMTTIWVMVDISPLTRSQIISKQLAHNFLVGQSDEDVLNQLLNAIDNPDDLLASGAPDDLLPNVDHEAMSLLAPRIDFDFRTITFSFLPHQQKELERLVEMTDGRQDLFMVCPREQFEDFVRTAVNYARIKKVLSGGTAVALMVRSAVAEIEAEEARLAEESAVEVEESASSHSTGDEG